MEHDRNPERSEVYERIPWEHLERPTPDRQWLFVGVAAAIALGVLAYSFVKNQPEQPSTVEGSVAISEVGPTAAPTSTPNTLEPIVSSPVVIAESDLYALDPEHLAATAAAHAEWFAVEYVSVDGSAVSIETLRGLLPEGVPLPEAPEGTQVFVDWVRARRVARIADFEYEVDVLVRSLVSTEPSEFNRQPVRMLRVSIRIGDDGEPRLSAAPLDVEVPSPSPGRMELGEVPPEVAASVAAGSTVIGGMPLQGGGWRLVVMAVDVDGVRRPQILEIP